MMLTDRQRQVKERLSKTDAEIALELNITIHTVRFHVRKLLKKYGVRSRHQIK